MAYGSQSNHQNNKNMEYKRLNIRSVIKGKIGNVFCRALKMKRPQTIDLKGYQLIKDLTPPYSIETKKNRVGIYQNEWGQKVVIKKVPYLLENLDSIYLRNEAYILKTLNMVNMKERIFPKFDDFLEENNQVSFITEYFDGKGMNTIDKKSRCREILKTFSMLRELSENLKNQNFLGLPVRKPFYYLFSFAMNLTRLIIKNPSKTSRYLKFGALFYRSYIRVILGDYTLGFVHRDLYPDNILYSAKKHAVVIIDWESSIVSDSLYDLAQIVMIYTHEIGIENTIAFLKANINNSSEARRFVGLVIFNSIQILTNNRVDHPVFKETETFLDTLTDNIIPAIFRKKSPFEIINSITLNVISIFYKITKLSKYSTKKSIILCYHSIGDTGWRYSVRTNNFKKQLDFLKNNYKLKSLREILADKNGGVHITFDDGYRDVADNAFPLLEKINAKATMFVLSNYQTADKKELDNNLPLLDYRQIKFLSKNGWEIGCHTKTHANLRQLTDSELKDEIIDSKKMLEKKLGISIKYFSYPKGIYSEKIIEYVKNSKYDAAFTVDGYDINPKNQNAMKLSRISIEGGLKPEQVEALLSPLGLFVTGVFIKILIFKERYFKKERFIA